MMALHKREEQKPVSTTLDNIPVYHNLNETEQIKAICTSV